jgi:hypothetical protein
LKVRKYQLLFKRVLRFLPEQLDGPIQLFLVFSLLLSVSLLVLLPLLFIPFQLLQDE